jgi:hypothetical protein
MTHEQSETRHTLQSLIAWIALACALIITCAPVAFAAPFVACDLAERTTHTALQFCTSINTTTNPPSCNTWGAFGADTPVNVVSPTVKECRNDIAAAVVGANIVRIKAIDTAGWAGREESPPSAPFAFTRPASLTSPAGIRLAP